MEERSKRRLAAILASDVVGFSRLMEADESGTLAALKSRRKDVLAPLVAKHQGRVFKVTGDGVLVEFGSAVNAVQCAVELQQAMAAANNGLIEDRQIVLRIGVNLGDVLVEGSDLYGDGVNIAARLEGIAEPGGILVSGTAFDYIKNKVNVGFTDLGLQSLKNITEPVRAYRVAGTPKVPPAVFRAISEKPSIAVLPFTNMSGDPEQEYFSDGITEDIITELSRYSELLVIARNSSFTYKGHAVDIRKIARELSARYVLEGSIRRSGPQLRITAQLIDSASGSHLWAEKYDAGMEHVIALQDEITRNVAASIAPQIELAETERSRKLSSSSLSAYDLALKSQALFYEAIRQGDPVLLDEAAEIANAALQLDPRNTHALAVLGTVYNYQYLYRWGADPDGALSRSAVIADRLMTIDAMNAKSYMIRAWVRVLSKDYDAAIADHQRAMQLNPNYVMNLFSMAWGEAVAGLTAEAKHHAHLALRLSPRDTDVWLGEGYLALMQATFAEGAFEETCKWGRLAIQMGPKVPIRRLLMVACAGHLGDHQTAARHAEALAQFAPKFMSDVLAGAIEVYGRPEHRDLVIEGLRKAGF